MNITNAVSQTQTFAVNNKTNTLAKPSARVAESVSHVDSEQLPNKKEKQSIVFDEQAIALFEQEKSQTATANFSSTEQDKPSLKNETAVASYQAINNLSQRESVQQLFGVDVFA